MLTKFRNDVFDTQGVACAGTLIQLLRAHNQSYVRSTSALRAKREMGRKYRMDSGYQVRSLDACLEQRKENSNAHGFNRSVSPTTEPNCRSKNTTKSLVDWQEEQLKTKPAKACFHQVWQLRLSRASFTTAVPHFGRKRNTVHAVLRGPETLLESGYETGSRQLQSRFDARCCKIGTIPLLRATCRAQLSSAFCLHETASIALRFHDDIGRDHLVRQ